MSRAGPGVLRAGSRILSRAVREQPRLFIFSLAGSIAYGGMIIAQAYVLGAATSRVVTPALRRGHADAAALGIATVAILGVALVKIAGIVGRRLAAGMMQYNLQATYRRRVTRRYLQLPQSWHARHPTGVLLSNANADVEALWYPIAPFPFAVGVVVIILVTLGLLVATNLALALLGALVFPAVVVTNTVYARHMAPRIQHSQQLRAEVSAIAHESFEGALVVKTLGREDAETARFRARANELRDALVRVGRLRGLFDPLLEAIPNLGTLLVLLIGSTQVNTGTLVRVAYLFSLLAFPLRAIGWLLAELPRSINGDDRVQGVLQATGEQEFGTAQLPAGGAPLGLRVQGLRFSYDDRSERADALGARASVAEHRDVLRDLTFDVAPGRTVAVVGATGSGKSTLAALLLRLMDPAAGRIELGGSDLTALRRGELAQAAALVAQQTFLFDDSVRDNVTLDDPYDDEQVWAALRLAQADGFVAALPRGLDSVIGERGTTLSGGQRQRLSLARALVRRPRLLVLDDATSSVDPAIEQAILAGLRGSDAPATTVLVAYRKATIALADEVLFLADGRLADRGSHLDLLARNDGYARIVSAYDSVAQSATSGGVAQSATSGGVAQSATSGGVAQRSGSRGSA